MILPRIFCIPVHIVGVCEYKSSFFAGNSRFVKDYRRIRVFSCDIQTDRASLCPDESWYRINGIRKEKKRAFRIPFTMR
jgi:hypothetical protein